MIALKDSAQRPSFGTLLIVTSTIPTGICRVVMP